MLYEDKKIDTVPVGPLGLIPLKGMEEFTKKVNNYLVEWRKERESEHKGTLLFSEYEKDNYIIKSSISRFGSGEAKGTIEESVRGDDLYLLVDVCNYSMTYSLSGKINHMSPDDHFQDLKRIIAAIAGKARRINVIMPFLYESRQHKKTGRESLDCALALQELTNMGVENIITFDAHDPRVQNSIPLTGFDNFMPTYQFVKALFENVPDLKVSKDDMMIISPDEGAMNRAVYLANNLGVDMGMFYKRRDYSKVIDGRNPIVAHEFLGSSVDGKDVIIMDDMISSGESMLDTAKELKKRNAKRIIICATFGLFTNGLDKFDEFHNLGLIDYVCTTNVHYRNPELLTKPWYLEADMTKYLAAIINSYNHDVSIGKSLSPTLKIQNFVSKFK